MDYEQRRELAEQARERGVTLDGHPACIVGFRLRFGLVRRLDERGEDIEYAWDTIARIVHSHGRFRS